MSALFTYGAGTAFLSVTPGSPPSSDPHTISGWIYPTSTANFGESVEINLSGGGVSVLSILSGTAEVNWRMSNATFSAFTDISFNANLNEWHHVIGTYDGTTMRLYVDGAAQGTATPGYGSRAGTWAACQIGPTNATVQDAKFYSAALSAGDAAVLSKQVFPGRTANLEMWYPLFAGASQRLVDWSGKGRTLSVNGAGASDGALTAPVAWGTGYYMFEATEAAMNVVAAGASSGAGSAVVAQNKDVVAAGSSLGAGSAIVGQEKAVVASGSSLSAGSAVVTQLKAIVASGGQTAAGSVVVTGGGTGGGGGGGAATAAGSIRQRAMGGMQRRNARRT